MSPSVDPKAAVVIGHGSAGQRHARLLSDIGLAVSIVSRRPGQGNFATPREALNANKPGHVVVATETADHARVLQALAIERTEARVLVEKPLFGATEATSLGAFNDLRVGYPLRLHSCLRRLRAEIAEQTVVSAQIYCGQYLPDWRPGRDYRETYSSDHTRGGGVLHDLSHELDYALWLFGGCDRLEAIGGTFGDLDIQADDTWGILARFERCPVATLQINYLFRPLRRECVVVTTEHSYVLDFRENTLRRDDEVIDRDDLANDALTRRLHRAFLEGDDILPAPREAGRVDALIQRIEQRGRGS